MRRRIFHLVAAVLLMTGCLDPSSNPTPGKAADDAYPRGVHPYPNGDEWPSDLTGPFEVSDYEHVRIPSFDGVILDGGIVRPKLPEGILYPTVLLFTPYVGLQNEPGDSPAILDYTFDAPVRSLVEAGYAFATISVRGTANSGGCFSFFGPEQYRDVPIAVDWLANQSWSNGRIGMMGVSYPATMALAAAVANPKPLKAIVVGGTHGDPYLRVATPQGAMATSLAVSDAVLLDVLLGYAPPPTTSDPEYATIDHGPVLRERVCPNAFEARAEPIGVITDDRNARYWNERRLSDRFGNATAATWYVQGYRDEILQFTDDTAWSLLHQAPKRILSGLWDHQLPTVAGFTQDLRFWFDFWLKGIGDPPKVGVVEYEDGGGQWHTTTSWPPADARDEALFFASGTLEPSAGSATQTFRAAPRMGPRGSPNPVVPQPHDPALVLCEDAGAPGTSIVSTTNPLPDGVLIAGNPYAYLRIASDGPSGLITLDLFDIGPGFSCEASQPRDARYLGFGAADLRFHPGTFTGVPFPLNTPTGVRIDVHGVQENLEANHRLAAALSFGDPSARHTQPGFPQIVVYGDSYVTFPVVGETLGGDLPPPGAPPRPFIPSDS